MHCLSVARTTAEVTVAAVTADKQITVPGGSDQHPRSYRTAVCYFSTVVSSELILFLSTGNQYVVSVLFGRTSFARLDQILPYQSRPEGFCPLRCSLDFPL